MKKSLCFAVFFALLLFGMVSLPAQENNVSEQSKVDLAYKCLNEKIDAQTCASISSEEKIFSLLALKKCGAEVESDSRNNGECWPSGVCKIKTTAQAVLALKNSGADTDAAEAWLLFQKAIPTSLVWYLQIDSNEEAGCTITYSNLSYDVNIGADKKISFNAGSCLKLSTGAFANYWLEVDSGCYGREFEISCDKGFVTTLLFQKSGSSTIHVSKEAHSASAEGATSEKVESYCFGKTSCDYEGSLWAAAVLDFLENDMSSYMPYLVTFADDEANLKYVPESFLYTITNSPDFRNNLLLKQKAGKWWKESDNKFYDTAVALYPFQFNSDVQEKVNSINWLLEVQGSDGCWNNGNIRDTAFILHSVWPGSFKVVDGEVVEEEVDCQEAGYYCMSSKSCQDVEGSTLDYSCSSLFQCCSKPKPEETCTELNGQICNSNEICVGGLTEDTSDIGIGQVCCMEGSCEEPAETAAATCEINEGSCKISCSSDETESFDYTCDYGDSCCLTKQAAPPLKKTSYLWIWILLVLIFLIVLGIIFKDSLRALWFKLKSKFGGGAKPGGFGAPRPPSQFPSFGAPPSRMMIKRPSAIKRPVPQQPSRKPSEMDEVLKKLKEMGK